jgi:hypothetical protein
MKEQPNEDERTGPCGRCYDRCPDPEMPHAKDPNELCDNCYKNINILDRIHQNINKPYIPGDN